MALLTDDVLLIDGYIYKLVFTVGLFRQQSRDPICPHGRPLLSTYRSNITIVTQVEEFNFSTSLPPQAFQKPKSLSAAILRINTTETQRLRGSLQDVQCSNIGNSVRRAELLFASLLCLTGLAINWLSALILELISTINRHLACWKSLGANSRSSTQPSP